MYCICKGNDVGNMIGCDNKKCKIQWFHFECVKIIEAPSDSVQIVPDLCSLEVLLVEEKTCQ